MSNQNTSDVRPARELPTINIVYIAMEMTSWLCLLLVLLTYILTRRRETVPGGLMINFCGSLFLLYTESTCNKFVWTTGSEGGCVAIAVLGHWFFLAMLTAIAAYAVWLHLKLVAVFTEEPSHFVAKAALVTWVVPLFVVVISVTPDYSQYQEAKHLIVCTAHRYAFYLGAVLPATILLLFSTSLMVLSVRAICKSQDFSSHVEIEDRQHLEKLRRRTKLFLCLLIMAVIGWGSALVASDENAPTVVFFITATPFLICGLGQGVFIFLFACVFNPKVRQDWRRMVLWVVKKQTLIDQSLSVQTISVPIGSSSRSINAPTAV